MNSNNIENAVKGILFEIGEDPSREGLVETPIRVAKMYQEIFSGYNEDYHKHAKTFSADGASGLVIINDIGFYSLCEHHMVPFMGNIIIGYIPDKKILGLSKFARIADVFTHRLQIQERLTKQILDAIVEILEPKGAAVYINAKHLCMAMRGVKKETSKTITTSFYGLLNDDNNLRREFLDSTH